MAAVAASRIAGDAARRGRMTAPDHQAQERAGPALAPAGPTLDRLTLRGLRARGRHGVHDFERRQDQEFVVDAVLGIDTRRAAAGDDLADTVDYGGLASRLSAVVT